MIQKLIDAMISMEGEKLRSLTWVVIEEVKDSNLGIGGKPYRPGKLVTCQMPRKTARKKHEQ